MDEYHCVVSVVGYVSHGKTFSSSKNGVGKSCLCCRFTHPNVDDYIDDHPSLLALHELESSVVCTDSFLYWGPREVEFPAAGRGKGARVKMEVVEHTLFYYDETSSVFPRFKKLQDVDCYAKQALAPPESSRKISYYSRDYIGFPDRYHCQPYPSNVNRIQRGFVVVVDVSIKMPRFEEHLTAAQQIVHRLSKDSKQPFIIAATKRDCADPVSLQRLVDWASKKKITIVETSAKENVNVKDVFAHIASRTLKNARISDSVLSYSDAIGISLEESTKTKTQFKKYLKQTIRNSSTMLSSVENSFAYLQTVKLFGKFRADEMYAIHLLEVRDQEVGRYPGVVDNPDMRMEMLEQFVEDIMLDLVAHKRTLRSLISVLVSPHEDLYVNEGGLSIQSSPQRAALTSPKHPPIEVHSDCDENLHKITPPSKKRLEKEVGVGDDEEQPSKQGVKFEEYYDQFECDTTKSSAPNIPKCTSSVFTSPLSTDSLTRRHSETHNRQVEEKPSDDVESPFQGTSLPTTTMELSRSVAEIAEKMMYDRLNSESNYTRPPLTTHQKQRRRKVPENPSISKNRNKKVHDVVVHEGRSSQKPLSRQSTRRRAPPPPPPQQNPLQKPLFDHQCSTSSQTLKNSTPPTALVGGKTITSKGTSAKPEKQQQIASVSEKTTTLDDSYREICISSSADLPEDTIKPLYSSPYMDHSRKVPVDIIIGEPITSKVTSPKPEKQQETISVPEKLPTLDDSYGEEICISSSSDLPEDILTPQSQATLPPADHTRKVSVKTINGEPVVSKVTSPKPEKQEETVSVPEKPATLDDSYEEEIYISSSADLPEDVLNPQLLASSPPTDHTRKVINGEPVVSKDTTSPKPVKQEETVSVSEKPKPMPKPRTKPKPTVAKKPSNYKKASASCKSETAFKQPVQGTTNGRMTVPTPPVSATQDDSYGEEIYVSSSADLPEDTVRPQPSQISSPHHVDNSRKAFVKNISEPIPSTVSSNEEARLVHWSGSEIASKTKPALYDRTCPPPPPRISESKRSMSVEDSKTIKEYKPRLEALRKKVELEKLEKEKAATPQSDEGNSLSCPPSLMQPSSSNSASTLPRMKLSTPKMPYKVSVSRSLDIGAKVQSFPENKTYSAASLPRQSRLQERNRSKTLSPPPPPLQPRTDDMADFVPISLASLKNKQSSPINVNRPRSKTTMSTSTTSSSGSLSNQSTSPNRRKNYFDTFLKKLTSKDKENTKEEDSNNSEVQKTEKVPKPKYVKMKGRPLPDAPDSSFDEPPAHSPEDYEPVNRPPYPTPYQLAFPPQYFVHPSLQSESHRISFSSYPMVEGGGGGSLVSPQFVYSHTPNPLPMVWTYQSTHHPEPRTHRSQSMQYRPHHYQNGETDEYGYERTDEWLPQPPQPHPAIMLPSHFMHPYYLDEYDYDYPEIRRGVRKPVGMCPPLGSTSSNTPRNFKPRAPTPPPPDHEGDDYMNMQGEEDDYENAEVINMIRMRRSFDDSSISSARKMSRHGSMDDIHIYYNLRSEFQEMFQENGLPPREMVEIPFDQSPTMLGFGPKMDATHEHNDDIDEETGQTHTSSDTSEMAQKTNQKMRPLPPRNKPRPNYIPTIDEGYLQVES